ncbi:Major facilitator superfamily MFS_1 [[Clostridium] ultunense Esp]|uniref:MFS transporter n=1 Tax=Thermicanus aegyptius TaxID=94009 RepID=UPI0002B70A72|nr:MFS transporter [Thermicanus aegyptius]CCQ92381.1 Major facilitator superfamily MFS_1 [[Clostridium] ultunense Esp]
MEIWKRNLIVLWVANFFVLGAMQQIMPFLPLFLQKDLGVSAEGNLHLWTGIIFGANFLTAFLFSPIWGNLADKIGRRVMILRSGLGMALITGAMGFVTSPEQLLILRLLNGMISGFIPASIALVSTNTPRERVGFALGVLQSGGVAGTILGPALGGLLADFIGFRNIFYVTGTSLFIGTLLVLFFVKEVNKPVRGKHQGEGFVKDFKKIMETKPLPALFGTGMLIQFSIISTMPIMAIYAENLLGHPQYVAFFAGLVIAATGVANMFASPFLGRLGDKVGSQHVLFYSLVAAVLFTLPHAFVTSIWQLILFRFLFGLSVGGLMPSVNALIRHFSPEGMESRTFGYANSATFIGNMAGPILGGWVADQFGAASVFIMATVVLLLNLFWVRLQVRDKMEKARLKTES